VLKFHSLTHLPAVAGAVLLATHCARPPELYSRRPKIVAERANQSQSLHLTLSALRTEKPRFRGFSSSGGRI